MSTLSGSVGKGGANHPADVALVQALLANHRQWLDPLVVPPADGHCGADTIEAIRKFQETAAALAKKYVTGLVSVQGFTIRRLASGYIPKPKHRVFNPVCWVRQGNTLTHDQLAAAATSLGCEIEAVKAVTEQEVSVRGMWDFFGRPTILYEPRKFRTHTKGVWNKTHDDISNGNTGSGKYSAQYEKLYRAATLDESAALKSCSWGAFQIMGENFTPCGYPSVEAFVDGMLRGNQQQLDAFVDFLNNDSYQRARSRKALRAKDWREFALGYNGSNGVANGYDISIGNIYRRLIALRPPARVVAPRLRH
jgi:hypothetical protein